MNKKRVQLAAGWLWLMCGLVTAQEVQRGAESYGPFYPAVFEGDLRDLPVTREWQFGDPIKEIPRLRHGKVQEFEPERTFENDPLLERQEEYGNQGRQLGTIGVNIAGQGFTGVNPPDTVGDVGLDHYIQAINGSSGSLFVVYNKSDGSVAAGPLSMDSLGAGNCASGAGDPIVLFDVQAQRWLLSEFSGNGNQLCVYISRTSNPVTGGWYNYSFTAPDFPDYPKYGVWNDGYYVTSNENTPAIYALSRDTMLTGGAALMQRFSVSKLTGFGFQALTPADHDSQLAPPNGDRMPIMRHRDDEVHNSGSNNPSSDFLELYLLDIDWNNSANSSLSGPTNIAIAEIDSSLCGLSSFNCFPQPGTGTTLDPLREVIMFRLAYMNFGTHESMVGCLVTDTNGQDHGGVRWFELRKTGNGSWSLFQEGTYAPDSDSRFMAGIGIDQSGNIALGYNVSSSSTFPSLRITGRETSDPAGVMTQTEQILAAGSASNGSNRYGDYSAMSLDPVDFCTFWFTGEYNQSSSWSTRIANFSFNTCGCTQAPATGLSAVTNGDNRIDISWVPPSGDNLTYSLYRAVGDCDGQFVLLQAALSGTTFSDTTVSGSVQYAYKVAVYNSAEFCTSSFSDCDQVTATGECRLPPSFGGLASVTDAQAESCGLELNWTAGTSNCSGSLRYNIYRSESDGFTPSAQNRIASCLNASSYLDEEVVFGTEYFYIVRAEDLNTSGGGACGGVEDSNEVIFSGSPTGVPFLSFQDDLESGTANWTPMTGSMSGSSQWTLSTAQSHSQTHSYFLPGFSTVTDYSIATASNLSIQGTGTVLSFWHRYSFETGFDGGVLEYSTDGGSNWQDILASDGGQIPANLDRFLQNGYTHTLTSNIKPLSSRRAWSSTQSSWTEVLVDLSDFSGAMIKFRWRGGTDSSQSGTGWYVDDLTVSTVVSCFTGSCPDDRYSRWPEDFNLLNLVFCLD